MIHAGIENIQCRRIRTFYPDLCQLTVPFLIGLGDNMFESQSGISVLIFSQAFSILTGEIPTFTKSWFSGPIVIESCEFAETFLKLTPYLSVVLNIDNDHLVYYGSMGELKIAFKRFALMTKFMILSLIHI